MAPYIHIVDNHYSVSKSENIHNNLKVDFVLLKHHFANSKLNKKQIRIKNFTIVRHAFFIFYLHRYQNMKFYLIKVQYNLAMTMVYSNYLKKVLFDKIHRIDELL